MLFEASSTMMVVGRSGATAWRGASLAATAPAPRRAAGRSKSLSPAQRFPRMAFVPISRPQAVIPVSNAANLAEIPLSIRPSWGVSPGLSSSEGTGIRHCRTAHFGIGNAALQPQADLMPNPALDLLLTRRSVSANRLGEPGPSQAELQLMLKAASR